MEEKGCPVWKVDPSQPKKLEQSLKRAGNLLKDDEVVGFPTETVYGLGGNAFSDKAIAKIFAAKGRPSNNPLIVHVPDAAAARSLVDRVGPTAQALMKAFWPGPLTIVLPTKKGKENKISRLVTCGLSSVGIRVPNHPVASVLLRLAGVPVAAPSANRSGKPSPTRAEHVLGDLSKKIAGVVDGGQTGIGLESTVVDCTQENEVVILRPGGVTIEDLRKIVKEVSVDPAIAASSNPKTSGPNLEVDEGKLKPKSPGMLYAHYAPNAPLTLVEGPLERLQKAIKDAQAKGQKVGALTTGDKKVAADHVEVLAPTASDLEAASRNLYGALRAFDQTSVEVIYAPVLPQEGIGAALANRMLKAAGKRVLRNVDKRATSR
ncbi:hypothetical protein AAMO2058_000776600 [Amorphochlora amoebiformis]